MEKVYPSWRYHKTQEPKVINSAAEEKALGKGWEETPAAFEVDEKSESPAPQVPAVKPNTEA